MDPRYPPVDATDDELLTRLAEECSEVIKVVMKIKRFGMDNHHPHTPTLTNGARLVAEMSDVAQLWAEIISRELPMREAGS